MNWYTVTFPNRQALYANGNSIEDVRTLLQEVYAFSGRYSTTREDIDDAEITEADVNGLETIKNKLNRQDTPFHALDRTNPDDDDETVTLWESRVNTAGKNSLYTKQLHRYEDPDTAEKPNRF